MNADVTGIAHQRGVLNPETLLTDDYGQLGRTFNQLLPALEEALADEASSQDSQDGESYSAASVVEVLARGARRLSFSCPLSRCLSLLHFLYIF